MSDYQCAFCGHPDSMHRVVDAITGRIIAGEPRDEALADYGWAVADFLVWSSWIAMQVMNVRVPGGESGFMQRPTVRVPVLPDCEDTNEEDTTDE